MSQLAFARDIWFEQINRLTPRMKKRRDWPHDTAGHGV
jgi:hypothetical protein